MKKILLALSFALATAFTCFAANPASDFDYDMAPDGQGVMLKSYKGKSTTVVIPDTIEGLPVTQIGDSNSRDRFFPHTMYTKTQNIPYTVTVPKSVKVVEDHAFEGLKGKINIDISNLTTIGGLAFYDSDLSGAIKISKDTKFTNFGGDVEGGIGAFSKSKITSVVIEEGVTTIGDFFSDCKNLKSVTLPKSLNTITGNAFNNCSALIEVNIPEGTKISYEANFVFKFCSSLTLAVKAKIRATGYTDDF